MSHFYAKIDRSARKTPATARGNKPGMSVSLASYSGAVRLSIWYDEETGLDLFRVDQEPWDNDGALTAQERAGITRYEASGIVGRGPSISYDTRAHDNAMAGPPWK